MNYVQMYIKEFHSTMDHPNEDMLMLDLLVSSIPDSVIRKYELLSPFTMLAQNLPYLSVRHLVFNHFPRSIFQL